MSSISVICKKRLLGDIRLLQKDPHKYIEAVPSENNLLEWYFLIKGVEGTDYFGGFYIGKIIFHTDYPFKGPDYVVLSPSGRFTIGTKICLSNSTYHQDEWSASWTIHAILTGFLSIMLDDKEHGISHIHGTKQERLYYAKNSIEYNKKNHPDIIKLFTRFLDENGNPRQEEILEKEPKLEKNLKQEPNIDKESILDKKPLGENLNKDQIVEQLQKEQEPLQEQIIEIKKPKKKIVRKQKVDPKIERKKPMSEPKIKKKPGPKPKNVSGH